MRKKWIAMFSQTGTEVSMLCDRAPCGEPDLILTNNKNVEIQLPNMFVGSTKEVYDELKKHADGDNVVVTLHGWLSIVPEEIIELFPEMYNGHPAPITLYPELKGKDPQERLFKGIKDGTYNVLGTVIHKVTPELDGGPIVLTSQRTVWPDLYTDVEDMNRSLRRSSMYLWLYFLGGKI